MSEGRLERTETERQKNIRAQYEAVAAFVGVEERAFRERMQPHYDILTSLKSSYELAEKEQQMKRREKKPTVAS